MVAMPVAYADTFYLSNDFMDYNPANVPANQTTVDDAYWYNMLTQISTSQANDGVLGESVPWVSYYVPDNTSPTWVNWAMSTPAYKELLRHIWLRGASGMYVFNVLRTPQQSFNELEYTTVLRESVGRPRARGPPSHHRRERSCPIRALRNAAHRVGSSSC